MRAILIRFAAFAVSSVVGGATCLALSAAGHSQPDVTGGWKFVDCGVKCGGMQTKACGGCSDSFEDCNGNPNTCWLALADGGSGSTPPRQCNGQGCSPEFDQRCPGPNEPPPDPH